MFVGRQRAAIVAIAIVVLLLWVYLALLHP